MPLSAFSHPYLCGLLGDEETARQFSAEAEIAAMLGFEQALANAEAAAGLIPVAAAERIGAGYWRTCWPSWRSIGPTGR